MFITIFEQTKTYNKNFIINTDVTIFINLTMETKPNCLNGGLLETVVESVTKNISYQNQRKQPLDLDIIQNIFTYGAINSAFLILI